MMPLLQKSKTAARDWLQGIDTALLRTVAAAAALCMLLAHGFAFTNLFPNHDSTVLVFDAQWTMYVLGRWAQNLYFPLVRGKVAAPWLIGAFSIVYLALTSYCITSLLHLKKWSAALLTGLLGTCASVTAQLATYTYETDAYLLAMLLACAAVWCTERLPRLWGYLGAAVCLCGLLGAVSILHPVRGGAVPAAAFATCTARRRVAALAASGDVRFSGVGVGHGTVSRVAQSFAGGHGLPIGRHWQRPDATASSGTCGGAGGHPGDLWQLFQDAVRLFRLE